MFRHEIRSRFGPQAIGCVSPEGMGSFASKSTKVLQSASSSGRSEEFGRNTSFGLKTELFSNSSGVSDLSSDSYAESGWFNFVSLLLLFSCYRLESRPASSRRTADVPQARRLSELEEGCRARL